MKISVLIAAYRAGPTIAASLASVRAQTHADWELVVVEDGSHDGTEATVRSAARAGPQVVRYENLGTNRGVAAARNRLLALATGDAVAFLDADDQWTPDHLQRGATHLAAGAELVATGVGVFDLATGRRLGRTTPPEALISDPIATLFAESVIVTSSSVLLSRGLTRRAGQFDEAFRVGEDRDYWLRAALAGGRFAIEPAFTCQYAKHNGSTMHRTQLVAAQTVRFYEKHAELGAVTAAHRRRQLARSLKDEARLLRQTDPRGSVRRLRRAWGLTPGDASLPAHLLYSSLGIWRPARRSVAAAPDRCLLVADQLGGQCGYSGIHRLAQYLRDQPGVRVLPTADTRWRRLIGKVWSLLHGGPVRNQSQSFTELQVDWSQDASPLAAVHFLVGENHDPFLSRPRSRRPVIATLHLPASARTSPPPRSGCVDTLVLLTAREQAHFAGAWGARRTVVIPHGVDTVFFRPGIGPTATQPVILVVGRFLRDFALTAATVNLLAGRHPGWGFDFVVPASAWHSPDLASVRVLPQARWHDRIGDEPLRRLYQDSVCHLTPFLDCTANNALVESLACGLPVVTTDRGGVRDYGAGTVYPLAAAHTAEALADLCERYAVEPLWRAAIANASRSFAVATLAWPVIARRHLALYGLTDDDAPGRLLLP